MHGNPQNVQREAGSQSSTLMVSTQLLSEGHLVQQECSQQVMRENQLANRIDSRVVDSAFQYMKAVGLSG